MGRTDAVVSKRAYLSVRDGGRGVIDDAHLKRAQFWLLLMYLSCVAAAGESQAA